MEEKRAALIARGLVRLKYGREAQISDHVQYFIEQYHLMLGRDNPPKQVQKDLDLEALA